MVTKRPESVAYLECATVHSYLDGENTATFVITWLSCGVRQSGVFSETQCRETPDFFQASLPHASESILRLCVLHASVLTR